MVEEIQVSQQTAELFSVLDERFPGAAADRLVTVVRGGGAR